MRLLCQCLAVLLAIAMVSVDARAQSVLRDAETEALLAEMAAPPVAATGPQPGNVDIVLSNDPYLNDFLAGGYSVYLHTGMIVSATHLHPHNGTAQDTVR